ncbi:MAG: TAXI family TRAP transporter solute-binding subunit [Dehalococcoidia bacterium]|nr:TAXI family TRAP transporter solute-binding subunit [Dehalococcoidia bacterium]
MNDWPGPSIARALLGCGLSLAFASGALAADPKLPPSVVLATHSAGSGFHADGSVIAKIVSERLRITMVVRPHPGPPAWLPAMNNGEIEFGVLTGADAAMTFRGTGAYRKSTPNIRLVMVGAPLYLAFWAAADSGVKTVADLKGKRVPTSWKGIPIVHFSSTANLATAGLTLNDVVQVPVAELNEGIRAFLEGRTDTMWHSVGAPSVQEANARLRGGIRLLPIGTSPEGMKRLAEIYPGTYKTILKKGSSVGILEDSPVASNDIYIVAPASLSEDVVAAVLKTVWDANEELRSVTPRMRLWTRERMVSTEASIPFHPGAVKFFREKGVWPAAMEKLQAEIGKH